VTPHDLEHYLYEHIPLSLDMAVRVLEASPDLVRLEAPLEPNVNYRGTVFGGSASAVAILAAWSLLFLRLRDHPRKPRLVIQRNTMEYLRPIQGKFEAVCQANEEDRFAAFVDGLGRRGKGRIELSAELLATGERVGLLVGTFVALSEAP
jgi:thioesterase domain-containing protein